MSLDDIHKNYTYEFDYDLSSLKDALDKEKIYFTHAYEDGVHFLIVEDLSDEQIGQVVSAAREVFPVVQPGELFVQNHMTQGIAALVTGPETDCNIDVATYNPSISHVDLAEERIVNTLARLGHKPDSLRELTERGKRDPRSPDGTGNGIA